MREQEWQALYAQLIGECQAEIMSAVEGTLMEERMRNDPMKLNAFVQKIVRQAMGVPQNETEPMEQDIRRSIRSQIEILRQQAQKGRAEALEMTDALDDFKMMLSSVPCQRDKELLNNAVEFLENLPRDPNGKPMLLSQRQVDLTLRMYTLVYPRVREWKESHGAQPHD